MTPDNGGTQTGGFSGAIYASPTDQRSIEQQYANFGSYYDPLKTYESNQFNQANRYQTDQYNNTIAGQQNDLNKNLFDLNNADASNGTWGSTSHAQRLNFLQNSANVGFNSAYNQTANNLYNLRGDQAYQYGDNALDNGYNNGIGSIKTDISNGTNNYQTVDNSGGQYNPFNFGLGMKTKQRQIESLVFANNALQANNAQYIAQKERFGNPYVSP